MSEYLVPAQPIEVEEVIKNSQFITRIRNVATVESAKGFIKELNRVYPDATHHCWAYIVGDPKSTTLLGCSDDGEPSGTAGKPMLNVLQHSGVGDIVAVCTRYYGGTKLGTGGLSRAYGGGVKLAVEQLALKPKINFTQVTFEIGYAHLKDCEHLFKDFQIEDYSVDYAENITINLKVASNQRDSLKSLLADKFKGEFEWTII